MSKFLHWNYLPKVKLGRSQICVLFFYFTDKSKIAIKCDCLKLFNTKLEGVQALSELARRADSTSRLKTCLSQWNKTPVYSCTGSKMGGFKLVTFPCLEKLSHTQHSILPWAVSPGTWVALSELEEYLRGRMVYLKTSPNLFYIQKTGVSLMRRELCFQFYALPMLLLKNILVGAQMTNSFPLGFFLGKISAQSERRHWGFMFLKNILKTKQLLEAALSQKLVRSTL